MLFKSVDEIQVTCNQADGKIRSWGCQMMIAHHEKRNRHSVISRSLVGNLLKEKSYLCNFS